MKYLLSIVLAAAMISICYADESATKTKKKEDPTKQIVGAWQLEFTTPDDIKRTPIVLVGRQHDELVGWYVEKDKPEAFKKIKLNKENFCC